MLWISSIIESTDLHVDPACSMGLLSSSCTCMYISLCKNYEKTFSFITRSPENLQGKLETAVFSTNRQMALYFFRKTLIRVYACTSQGLFSGLSGSYYLVLYSNSRKDFQKSITLKRTGACALHASAL